MSNVPRTEVRPVALAMMAFRNYTRHSLRRDKRRHATHVLGESLARGPQNIVYVYSRTARVYRS